MARADWLEAGATLVAGGGAAALTVDRLCALVGKTKGAFYHHFGAMPAFEQALLEHWREANLSRVEDAAPGGSLEELAVGLSIGLEGAVRRWSAVHPAARAAVEAVDRQRIAWLTQELAQELDATERAGDYALIEYAAFLGLLDLLPVEELPRLTALLRDKIAAS